MLKRFGRFILLAGIILVSLGILVQRRNNSMLVVMGVIIGLLLFFSLIGRILVARKSAMADEIVSRTVTWWWMAAVFIVAVSTHRIVSFCFMGFLCFLALREYFSLLSVCGGGDPKNPISRDRLPAIVCHLAILVLGYLAYTQKYGLYIILVPVYTFLLIPIIFVLQNRAEGTIRSIGLISIGLMFFVFNLGHSLFMINLGAMVLLYCFFLTEARDLLSFWVGKGLASFQARIPGNSLLRLLNTKIAVTVSPKKTWGAGIITASLVTLLSLAFVPIMPDFARGRLSYTFAAVLGLLIGFLGLMGDMVFSMVKRDMGIKDSGTMLPGHGGIIDRVDSLIFTVPITFHMINWLYA
ncbi:hypothetical protein AMJ39_08320 [candidate division TA06 bacterium DG_24]|nr:MAG: hypothetical protein AMJ39_08320 [candidate division TA06 bacterium DG_24]KPK67084.1 MAG: hypothetical protein AMJ82_11295 [candidate division TA06 bacterium SM23_40]